jgi:hypothetical protein
MNAKTSEMPSWTVEVFFHDANSHYTLGKLIKDEDYDRPVHPTRYVQVQAMDEIGAFVAARSQLHKLGITPKD